MCGGYCKYTKTFAFGLGWELDPSGNGCTGGCGCDVPNISDSMPSDTSVIYVECKVSGVPYEVNEMCIECEHFCTWINVWEPTTEDYRWEKTYNGCEPTTPCFGFHCECPYPNVHPFSGTTAEATGIVVWTSCMWVPADYG